MNKDKYFQTIKEYRLLAKKEVGQNFLIDSDVAERIVGLLPKEGKVLEIGFGAGSLSYFLVEGGYDFKAIDIDEGLLVKLHNDFPEQEDRFFQENVLKSDLSAYQSIIGNLPYYITTKIIEKFVLEATMCNKAVFMVQKEAYERLFAKASSKDYSPLGILLNLFFEAKKEFSVPPSSFSPAPHVDSLVFSLSPKKERKPDYIKGFYAFLNALFASRRKTLGNNLKKAYGEKASKAALAAWGEDYASRAEQRSPECLENLFKCLLGYSN